MDEPDVGRDKFTFSGEFWLAAQREHEEEALAGRAGFLTVAATDGSRMLAIFTDEDLAERCIREQGTAANVKPARFHSTGQFYAFLQGAAAAGLKVVVLDPRGVPREEAGIPIVDFLRNRGRP